MGEAQDRAVYAKGVFMRHLESECDTCKKASGTRHPDAEAWPCWVGQELHEKAVRAAHDANLMGDFGA